MAACRIILPPGNPAPLTPVMWTLRVQDDAPVRGIGTADGPGTYSRPGIRRAGRDLGRASLLSSPAAAESQKSLLQGALSAGSHRDQRATHI